MQLYSFRNVADAVFLLVALALAVSSFLLITSTLVDHLRNYRYPALQVCGFSFHLFDHAYLCDRNLGSCIIAHGPVVQTCCMRIMLLAPIYSLVSWCMMVFLPFSAYIEIFRDIYEAYTLYCFWVMLVLWCGGQRRVIEIVDRQEAMGCYLCPLVQPCGCGLPVYRFRSPTTLFRWALHEGCLHSSFQTSPPSHLCNQFLNVLVALARLKHTLSLPPTLSRPILTSIDPNRTAASEYRLRS